MLAYLLLSLFALLIIPSTAAVSVNITVDDTFGNSDSTVIPTYLPAKDLWHIGSPTEQCNACPIKPSQFDISQILDQSWHHATYYAGIPVQVQVTFHGTAVYVYNIIPNYLNGANTVVNLSFSIDGQTVGQFTHTPDSSSTILYNHLVYAKMGLSDSAHTLVMSVPENDQSLIIFDYLVYTTEVDHTAAPTTSRAASSTPSTSRTASSASSSFPALIAPSSATAAMDASTSSRPHTVAIVGGVIGGIILLLVVSTLFFLIFCRRRRKHASPPIDPYSFTSTDMTLPPMAGLSGRPVSRGMYSNTAAGPSLDSSAVTTFSSQSQSSRTFETKRELELKRRMEMLQREMALCHHGHGQCSHGALTDSDGSDSSQVSVGAVQALQEEIAALRGVLSGMAAHVGHNQPAICESEILPEYEETHWSASENVGSGISGRGRW